MQKLSHIVSMFIIFFASITSVQAEGEVTYVKVTDVSQIVDGDEYLLKVTAGDNGSLTYYANSFEINVIKCIQEYNNVTTNPYLITLHAIPEKENTFLIKVGSEYLASNNGNLTKNVEGINGLNYHWTISFVNEAVLINEYNDDSNILKFNGKGTKKEISINSTSTGTIYLYHKGPINSSVDVSVSSAGYASFCSTQKLDFTDSGIEAYYATLNGTTLNLKRINRVPANTGLILYKENGTDAAASINPCEGETESAEGNCLTASTTSTTVTEGETIYVLSTIDGETAFYPAATGLEIPAGKAYIRLSGNAPESASAKPLTFNFMQPTAINMMQHESMDGASSNTGSASSSTDGASFSIDGKPAETGHRGIIIKDGKKILNTK